MSPPCPPGAPVFACLLLLAAGCADLSRPEDLNAGWSASVLDEGGGRLRIAVARDTWPGPGEGDYARRWRAAAETVCRDFTILSYTERYEPAVASTRRIADGAIACREPAERAAQWHPLWLPAAATDEAVRPPRSDP